MTKSLTEKIVHIQNELDELFEMVAYDSTTNPLDCMQIEIDRLHEQLKEANNIIVRADWDCDCALQMKCGFSEYLSKYKIEGLMK